MSYCVNCGVQLDDQMKACPLCNTVVMHPGKINNYNAETAFPKEKGQVDVVKKKDFAILLSVILAATGITCGLLNLLVFHETRWSLLIIGGCVLLWAMFVPLLIYSKLSSYISLLFDGMAIGFYLYLITFVTITDKWLCQLGLPITALTILIAELWVLSFKKLPVTFITSTIYIFTGIGLYCVLLEILIDLFTHGNIALVWSAVVGTVCVIIDITMITVLSRKRLRNAVRRRLHF